MKYHYICNLQELIPNEHLIHTNINSMIEELSKNPIKKGKNLMLNADVETEGFFNFENKLLSLQLANEKNAYFIAIQYLAKNELTVLTDWLNNCDYIFIFHNAKFDIKFLSMINVTLKNVYCTYVMELYINSSREEDKGYYSLKGLVERYFNVSLNKEIRGKINHASINDTEVIFYSLDDVKYLDKILEKQIGILVQYNHIHKQVDLDNLLNKDTLVGLENRTVLALAEAELAGITIDMEAYNTLCNNFNPLYEQLLNKIKEVVYNCDILSKHLLTNTLFGVDYKIDKKGKQFNWASAQQKLLALRLLFPELPSVSTPVLSNYIGAHPIIELLLEYSKLFKLKTSFIDTLPTYINKITGKVHGNINQMVSTGRMSMDNPNLQQIPKKGEFGNLMRQLFKASTNNILIGGDFSSCELAIIANNSEDTLWLDTIANKDDLHGILASKTFNIDLKDVKSKTTFNKDISYRDIQKTIDFGLAYGMSHIKLSNTMRVDEDMAKSVIDAFFAVVPKVKKYLTESGKFAIQNSYSVTNSPYNRIRKFFNLSKGQKERAGKNAPIQGTNADITKRAIVDIYEYKMKNKEFSNFKLVLFVHDEIIVEGPENLKDRWLELQKEIMMKAALVSVPKVQIQVDIKATHRWEK